jgi:hypothetical protein
MIFCAWLGRFMNVMMHQSEKQKITVELKGESGVLEYKQKKHRPGFLLQVPLDHWLITLADTGRSFPDNQFY